MLVKRYTHAELREWLRSHRIRGGAVQFQSDAQMLTAAVTLVTTAETTIISTNFLPIPLELAKFLVSGSVLMTSGTGVTGVQIRVRRNINGENVVLGGAVATIPLAASTTGNFGFDFTDSVPDGRSCQYSLTVQQVGATGNGSVLVNTSIASTCLSA